MDKEELWNEIVRTMLSAEDGDDLKGVFLNRITPMGIFGNSFVLLAQNSQVEEWINEHYLVEIGTAADQIYGQHLTIGIASNDGSHNQPSPTHEEPSVSVSSQNTPPAAGERGKDSDEPTWDYVNPNDFLTKESAPAISKGHSTVQETTPPAIDRKNQALYSKCTFDSFVVGDSNNFAYSAALAAAEQPGTAYNPLFIYGSSGLGKTHLLIAIANYINQNFPQMATVYVSANDFLNDYVKATQKNQWNEFNQKYHQVDALLIDDVQYLENKEETINQLFNIFNEMTSTNNQIVLSADRAPHELNMDERMRSRFNSGLLADVKPPNYETRLAILKNFLQRMVSQMKFYGSIPDEVLSYLAEISTSNIREIEGAITRLMSNMSLLGKDTISVEETREILKDFFPDLQNRKIEISTIMGEVERYYSVSHEDMISPKRQKGITIPRHIAIYLSRYLTEESLSTIGQKFGGRDHSTILHSVTKIEQEMQTNRVLAEELDVLERRIRDQG